MDLISREEAREKGLKRYYTGKPCRSGHVSERYVAGGACVECDVRNQRVSRENNIERARAKDRERYRRNPEHRLKGQKKSYEKNKEAYIATVRRWIDANPDKVITYKEKSKQTLREYNRLRARRDYQLNRERWRDYKATRRAKKLDAQPVWVDTKALTVIYDNCPKGYEVDHEIPLNHKLVCGLHVPWNLKAIPKIENRQKSNKFDPETYVHTFP